LIFDQIRVGSSCHESRTAAAVHLEVQACRAPPRASSADSPARDAGGADLRIASLRRWLVRVPRTDRVGVETRSGVTRLIVEIHRRQPQRLRRDDHLLDAIPAVLDHVVITRRRRASTSVSRTVAHPVP
jgi:hypothetical protein